MIQRVLGFFAGANPTLILVVAAAAMSGYAGWAARDTVADMDSFEVQLAHANERAELANVAIRERDNALEKTREMNQMAASAEQRARADRAKMQIMLGAIDNAPDLPADCHLDDERLRQLRDAP